MTARRRPTILRFAVELTIGFKAESTLWSNLRRASNRLSIALVALLLIEANSADPLDYLPEIALFCAVWSVAFFAFTVASVIFLGGRESDFEPAPFRLIFDIFISGAISIMAFALVYRVHGLVDTLTRSDVIEKLDFVYFAIVSFSTLGYGDFRIESSGRLLAGSHAIIGNLHLGLLAGAVYYALQRGTEGAPDGSRQDDNRNGQGADSADNDH